MTQKIKISQSMKSIFVFWPPDVKNGLIGKDPDTGKDCGQEEKGIAEVKIENNKQAHLQLVV